MRKQAQYTGVKGMNQDLSISKYSPEFTFKNYNMKINSSNESTLLTLTNAKGNNLIPLKHWDDKSAVEILGTTINTTVLNDYLVLFTTTRETTTILIEGNEPSEGTDRIYRLHYNNGDLLVRMLFEGNLNFATDALIETVGMYETEDIAKIYWVDKNNQPRFINIMSNETLASTSFDFCPELLLNEELTTKKNFSGGKFHSGVVQYAYTYWNLNGVETNIVDVTELHTITDADRGGSAEEIHSCSFTINIDKVDNRFEFLRVYSIQRTSLEAQPVVRIVQDVNLTKTTTKVSITDDGLKGSDFPTESLLFIGGEELILGTIATKDNALFAGDITLKRPSLESISPDGTFSWHTGLTPLEESNTNSATSRGLYTYSPYTLSKTIARHWKKGETYRFGLRAQYKTGIWSEVLYLLDTTPDKGYKTNPYQGNTINGRWVDLEYVVARYTLSSKMQEDLGKLGFKKFQLVYVPLASKDREIIAQGVLTNTIANVGRRESNSPFAYPDYFTRGNNEFGSILENRGQWGTDTQSLEWSHLRPLTYRTSKSDGYWEIGGRKVFYDEGSIGTSNISKIKYGGSTLDAMNSEQLSGTWFIDSNLLNMWGPDIEYGNVRHNLGGVSKVRLRGIANLTGSSDSVTLAYKNGHKTSWGTTYQNYNSNSFLGAFINPYTVYRGLYENDLYKNGTAATWDYPKTLYRLGIGDPETLLTSNKKLGKHDIPENNVIDASVNYWYYPLTNRTYSRFVYSGFNHMVLDTAPTVEWDITKPTFIDKSDMYANHDSGFSAEGSGGSIVYNNHVNELDNMDIQRGAVEVNYKGNTHLLFNLADNKFLPSFRQGGTESPVGSVYYRMKNKNGIGFTSDRLSTQTLFGKPTSFYTLATATSTPTTGFGYLFVVDLIRDVSEDSKYGGNSKEAIEGNTWIPAGPSAKLNTWARGVWGDTYIQRYDVLKTSNNTSTLNYTSEVLSVLLESYVNMDARYDKKRGMVDVANYTTDNYTQVNDVYDQKDNVFTSTVIDYKKFSNDKLKSSLLISQPKMSGEFIDKWTNLWINNAIDVDGSLGKINKVLRHNDTIFGFQNKGIFQALYNSRVQIPVTDGVPIEIAQSMKMDGVRYLTTSIGVTNKWAIKNTNKSLYFMDSFNKDIYTFGEGLTNVTEELGFKSWATNAIRNTSEYDLRNNRDAFIFNTDSIEDDLYINNYQNSLQLSERLSTFESFHSYEDIPWMVNLADRFLSIQTGLGKTVLWENHSNTSNRFFGYKSPSYIEFHINPEPHLDKVFDNLSYRADVLDIHNTYLAGKTFDSAEVWNEFQQGSIALNTPQALFRNKKFRNWSYPFPRQMGTMNRIRNPWVKMKLTFNNQGNHRLYFHDMIVTYTI